MEPVLPSRLPALFICRCGMREPYHGRSTVSSVRLSYTLPQTARKPSPKGGTILPNRGRNVTYSGVALLLTVTMPEAPALASS